MAGPYDKPWMANPEIANPDNPIEPIEPLLEPITTVPFLSAFTRKLGDAAKYIDDTLPTTPLDPYIPNVETLANFTPGIGDLQTGEYSALDMLGVGLDAVGLGAATDLMKARKIKKYNEALPREMHSPTGRAEDVRYTPEYMAERQSRVDNVAGASEADIRQAILNRNAQARADIAGGNIPIEPYNPSPEMRRRLDEIGAPSNEEIARMNAEITAGVVPEGVVDSLPEAAIRNLNSAGDVSENLITKLDNINYEDFNIQDFDLFGIVGQDNLFPKTKKRFFRNDKSQTNVIMNISPGNRPGAVRIRLHEGGKEIPFDKHWDESNKAWRDKAPSGDVRYDDTGKSYFEYNIEEVMTPDGLISRIDTMRFYAKGKGLRPQYEASRLLRDALKHAPDNAVLSEDIMTLDALFLTLKEMVKRPKAKFSIDPTRTRGSGPGQYSRASKLAKEGNVDGLLKVFADLEEKLIKQGQIPPGESLNLKSRFTGGDLDLEFSKFTIRDFKGAVPLMLGFDDWEQMSKHLDEGDDVVNSVIDLEQGIF
jgi:hypothetical protein